MNPGGQVRRHDGLVSTVIPVFNRAERLAAAVISVLTQTYRPLEIIIVDDGSNDATPQVARELESAHPQEIRYLRQVNQGPGRAREAGRQHARGAYIQYLDSDDRLLPDKFAEQVDALRARPECGVAYGKTRLVDTTGRVLVEPYKWTGALMDRLFPALLVDRWWCTHTPLYRRSVCDAVGPWTDLRFSQDWEYDARVGALGTRLVSTDTWVSEHTRHEDPRQTGAGEWLQPRDQLRFFQSLHQSAHSAGVSQTAPQMLHFARWVFAQARRAGARGDAESARALLKLAAEAAGRMDMGMKFTALAASSLGWRVVGSLSALRDRMAGQRVGKFTLRQSWMKPAGD